MMIMVDPTELVAASATLRSCASEAADIGSQLWACAQCPMPSELQGVVDQLVAASDRALDSAASQLNAHAVDLANRAQIAVNDSLVAALVSAGFGASGSTIVAGSLVDTMTIAGNNAPNAVISGSPFDNMVIGGNNAPNAVISGSPFDNMVIGGNNAPNAVITGSPFDNMVIGGNNAPNAVISGSPFDNMVIGGNNAPNAVITGSPFDNMVIGGNNAPNAVITGSPFVIGGTPHYTGMAAAAMVAAEAGQRASESLQRQINAIVSAPNSTPEMIRIALNAQTSLGDSIGHLIAYSPRNLEDRYGYPLSNAEIRRLSPNTILDPVNLFDLS